MTIKAYTLNITYEDTTRPITFVENDVGMLCRYQIVALTLYTFKDLIPDYQRYYMMTLSFNIREDKEAQLILPSLEFKFSVETLGHGTLDIVIDNPQCHRGWWGSDIKKEIQKQIGIPIECIKVCNSEGIEVSHNIYVEYNSNQLFAIFNDYKDQVLEKGYEIIEYKSVFKEGRMMRVKCIKTIGNYKIVKFTAEMYSIVKRTPKMIVLDNDRHNQRNVKKKIAICSKVGEYIRDCFSGQLVAWDETIQYDKEYALPN